MTHIYHLVTPWSIPYERHTRRFRKDQRGSFLKTSPLLDQDIIYIARNTQIIEKAVLQFEQEIIYKVKDNKRLALNDHVLTL